jgi:hypothetical protein
LHCGVRGKHFKREPWTEAVSAAQVELFNDPCAGAGQVIAYFTIKYREMAAETWFSKQTSAPDP